MLLMTWRMAISRHFWGLISSACRLNSCGYRCDVDPLCCCSSRQAGSSRDVRAIVPIAKGSDVLCAQGVCWLFNERVRARAREHSLSVFHFTCDRFGCAGTRSSFSIANGLEHFCGSGHVVAAFIRRSQQQQQQKTREKMVTFEDESKCLHGVSTTIGTPRKGQIFGDVFMWREGGWDQSCPGDVIKV